VVVRGGREMSAPVETILVKADEAGLRLDRWFRVHFPEIGYSYLQKLLRSGQVRVDSRRAQANWRLQAGQHVRVPQVVRTTGSSVRRSCRRPGFRRPIANSSSD
jgi:23S rRNA pseudouridine955/2504/2580 synthase